MRSIVFRGSLFLMLVLGWVLPTLAQELPDSQPVLDFIAENPDDVAILCYTPGDEPAVAHNADEPFALASTYKLVILAELARQTEAGLIDPTEEIELTDVNAYWLPGTDGNAHQTFLDSLPPDTTAVSLNQIARAMIQFSSNAAPDYLLSRLGIDGFPELFEQLGLEHTDMPSTYLGLYLAADNHETGKADPATLDVKTLTAERARLESLFLTDPDWREAELAYIEERATANEDAIASQDYEALEGEYQRQADFFQQFGVKGSARDMLRVLEAAYKESIFSENGRTVMHTALDWLFEVNPANEEVYDVLATKGGSWASIFTGGWYVDPKQGDSLALAVFYRNLPIELWGDWSTTGTHQILEVRAFGYGEGCEVFENALG